MPYMSQSEIDQDNFSEKRIRENVLEEERKRIKEEIEPIFEKMTQEGRGLVVSHFRFELDRILKGNKHE